MYLNKPNPKAFGEYANTMDYVYNNINDYSAKRSRKNLFLFDDMIADINTDKKISSSYRQRTSL